MGQKYVQEEFLVKSLWVKSIRFLVEKLMYKKMGQFLMRGDLWSEKYIG